jgi:hypothetical protein
MDMTIDVFAEYSYGKAALKKIAPTDENFRLYFAGWLGDGLEREVMKVTGAVFRQCTRGQNKGLLSIKVPDTARTVYVTAKEMAEYDSVVN